MSEASLVYVTAGSAEEAGRIAASLVEARLVACANVLPGVRSVYWWEGAVQQDDEVVLVCKTRSALVHRVTEAILGMHSYDCPCVVALPIEGGNPAFLDWIRTETVAGQGGDS